MLRFRTIKPQRTSIEDSKSRLAQFTRAALLGLALIGLPACDKRETVDDFPKVCAKPINVYSVGVDNPFIVVNLTDQTNSREVMIHTGWIRKIDDEGIEVYYRTTRGERTRRIKFNKITKIEEGSYVVLVEKAFVSDEVRIWLGEQKNNCI